MTGALIAIGGAEAKIGDMVVLNRILSEAQGHKVHVISTATSFPEDTKKKYEDAFHLLGVDNIAVSHINSRAQANDPLICKQILDADILFFSGGDQLRLTFNLAGTAALDAIKQAHENGAVIAGTSAGAAVMSSVMLYGGSVEKAIHKGEIKTTAGLGFLKESIVDTHFMQRGRLPRLFNVLATNPAILGIGIDEDTALIVRGNISEVIGSGVVTFVDGTDIESDILDKDIGQEFTISNMNVLTVAAGERYDLQSRAKIQNKPPLQAEQLSPVC